MTLDHWLTSQKISAEEFGKLLGCSGQAVRYWRAGARMPDADMVEKISAATGGQVTVQDLHDARLVYVRAAAPEEVSPDQARFFRGAPEAAE